MQRAALGVAVAVWACGAASVAAAPKDWAARGAQAALDDADPQVVARAISELVGDPPVHPPLDRIRVRAAQLRADSGVRSALAMALATFGMDPATTIPELVKMLKDDDAGVAASVAAALEKYRADVLAAQGVTTAMLRAASLRQWGYTDRQDGQAPAARGPLDRSALVALLDPGEARDVGDAFAAVHGPERDRVAGELLALLATDDDRARWRVFDALVGLGVINRAVLEAFEVASSHGARPMRPELAVADSTEVALLAKADWMDPVVRRLAEPFARRAYARIVEELPYSSLTSEADTFVRLAVMLPDLRGEVLRRFAHELETANMIAGSTDCQSLAEAMLRIDRSAAVGMMMAYVDVHLDATGPESFRCSAQVLQVLKRDRAVVAPGLDRRIDRVVRDPRADPDAALALGIRFGVVDDDMVSALARRLAEVAHAGAELNDDLAVAAQDFADRTPSDTLGLLRARASLVAICDWTPGKGGCRLLARGIPLSISEALGMLAQTYRSDPPSLTDLRFWALYLSGGDPVVRDATRWLTPPARPLPLASLDGEAARSVARSFLTVIEQAPPGRLVVDARDRLLHLVAQIAWQPADAALLDELASRLEAVATGASGGDPLLAEVRARRTAVAPSTAIAHAARWAGAILGAHLVVWLALLLLLYPRSPRAQAALIWNPWLRQVFGLGYAHLVVLLVPALRRRLFAPFADQLIDDAELERLRRVPYFDSACLAQVRRADTQGIPDRVNVPIPLAALWQHDGRIVVIEGKSGFGKSHAMRATIEHWRAAGAICAFIAAGREDEPIVALLARKLGFPEASHGLLRSLIHVGAMRIVIDGLNEASPTMLVHVTAFLGEVRRGQVYVTTQPLAWKPPVAAQTYRALPLDSGKVEAFLVAQWPNVVRDGLDEAQYGARVHDYVAGLGRDRDSEVLCTPMDLTLVAELLAQGRSHPTIHGLRAEAFACAKVRYGELGPGGVFPEEAVQQAAIAVLASGQVWQAPGALEGDALRSLLQVRMAIVRAGDAKTPGTWRFRHDSITAFFAAQSYATGGRIRVESWDDLKTRFANRRFDDACADLAERMVPEDACELGRLAREHAARTGERTLADRLTEILDRRARREAWRIDVPEAGAA